jgi:RNA polymerase sigma-70 factor (ECF subfamily)
MPRGVDFSSTLAAARTGEQWAMAALYRAFQPSVLRYLHAQEPRDAEDLASEVWLDVGPGLARFDGTEGDLRCWIFTIARRRLIDHRRARTRRRTDPVAPETFALRADESENPGRFEGDQALSCLSQLPQEWAEIILLRVVAGLDSNDVAAVTGRKPGTVRVIQKRALERLAELLSSDRDGVVTP